MENVCIKTSIKDCINCNTYDCKNLYGPIKKNSRCYNMIWNKLFDECVFIGNGDEPNGCAHCEYMNTCSTLIRECVVLMGT